MWKAGKQETEKGRIVWRSFLLSRFPHSKGIFSEILSHDKSLTTI